MGLRVHDCTVDAFLGGRITAVQPKSGFRAGHDTVLLAATVPTLPGESVLELGSGTGIASLCLAWRCSGVRITGLELEADLVALANGNAARNGIADRVNFVAGDIMGDRPVACFSHVFFNPPFHPPHGTRSNLVSRDRAKRDTGDTVAGWTTAAIGSCLTQGTVTAIVRTDRVDEMLAAAPGYATLVFPLHPHDGEAPKRTIVQMTLMPGQVHHCSGLVLHRSDGRSTEAADAVLRSGEALSLR